MIGVSSNSMETRFIKYVKWSCILSLLTRFQLSGPYYYCFPLLPCISNETTLLLLVKQDMVSL